MKSKLITIDEQLSEMEIYQGNTGHKTDINEVSVNKIGVGQFKKRWIEDQTIDI